MLLVIRSALLLSLSLLVPCVARGESPPDPPEQGKKEADAGRGEQAGKPQKPAKPPKVVPPRQRIRATLKETVVHFSFRRAPLADIYLALERATALKVRIGSGARKALEKRKFKIKYVADRTGLQVLQDTCKAAALDFLVSDEGVLVDLPATIKKLRKKLKLEERALRLNAKDVASMLETKELTLSSRKKPLSTVLAFLTQETGVRFVRISPAPKKGRAKPGAKPPLRRDPLVSVHTTSTPLAGVLDLVTHPIAFDWLRTGSVILVGPKDEIAAQRKPLPKKKP